MIRFAKECETSVIKQIWHECFGDTDPFLTWNFTSNYVHTKTLVYISDGKIAATLQYTDYTVDIEGQTLKCGYIFGLATCCEYRMRGFSRALLKYTEEYLSENGYDAALLIPFSYKFYEKYGYELCGKLLRFDIIDIVSNSKKPLTATDLKCCQILGTDQAAVCAVQAAYTNFCCSLSGYIKREDNQLRLILENNKYNNNGQTLLYEKNNYAIYYCKDNVIFIEESVFTDSDKLMEMIGCILNMHHNIEKINVTLPYTHINHFLTRSGYQSYVKVYPHAMVKCLSERSKQVRFINNDGIYFNMLFA